MLDPAIRKLISIASSPLVGAETPVAVNVSMAAGARANELSAILKLRNGFFAFEGALRFFPSVSVPASYGLGEWNSNSLWRSEYGALVEGCFFFAEDVFGGQFCTQADRIWTFDPETGAREFVADSLDQWADAVLADYEVLTGHRIAHDWQAMHGELAGRERLIPKVPFVVGGEFQVSNLKAIDAAEGMRSRGNLARQLHSLPDGAQIKIQISS